MALFGYEWLVVVGILFIVVLYKPKAITDLARSFGQVAAEFRRGKDIRDPSVVSDASKEELLAETAERLGIKTEGKTDAQIRRELLAKAGRPEN